MRDIYNSESKIIVFHESTKAVISLYHNNVVTIEEFLDNHVHTELKKPSPKERRDELKKLIERHMFFDYNTDIFLKEIEKTLSSIQQYDITDLGESMARNATSNKELVTGNIIHEWGLWLRKHNMVDYTGYYNEKITALDHKYLRKTIMICNSQPPYIKLWDLINMSHPEWQCLTLYKYKPVLQRA